jgi:hypothetical protein
MISLYTFIMDYLGGTYVSQVRAHNENEAMILWAEKLETDEIKGLTHDDKAIIIENGLDDDEAVLLTGLENVWCFDIRTKGGFALINFIKTQQ